jgi:putative ABC transport system permease protein
VKRTHVRGLMVIGELALAMVLLAGAGVLMRSFVRVSTPEEGYDDRQLLTGSLEFLDARYTDRGAVRGTMNDIVDRVSQIPGVTNVATHRFEFIAGFGREDRGIRAEGVAAVPDGVSPRFYGVVSPGYFATVRLPVVSGRGFDAQDRVGSTPVVMINKRMAETLWPYASPTGRRIKLGMADSLPWVTVVGIVGDITSRGQARNYAYVPVDQAPSDRATLLVRAQDDQPLKLIAAVRSAVRAIDPDLPVLGLQTVAQQQRANYWPYEMYSIAMGIFATFAILLAAIGLYGVIAYNTAQRTREIGVRIAIGAEGKHIVALIVRDGGRLVAIGIVLGIASSVLLLRALSAMLFGASPIDVPIFAAVSAVLAVVALAAIWVPARRAARVSPLEALRAE